MTSQDSSSHKIRSRRSWLTWCLLGLAVAALVTVGDNWGARAFTSRFVSPFGDDTTNSGGNPGTGMCGGVQCQDCSSPDSPCKTIQNAVNQSFSGDLIEVAPGTYTENVEVSQSVTIQGDAFNPSIVDGNNAGPVFIVDSGNTVTFSMLTIRNGNASGESNVGGGIQNNDGTVSVVQSTISGNQAGGSGPAGGGIFNSGGGTLTVINSTISGNKAVGGAGGGIFNASNGSGGGGTATLVNATINGNTAASAMGGGIDNATGATLNFTNTIVSGSPAGGDCVNAGTIGTNSHNLVQDGSCSPAVSGNPKLGPLQNNGGPTNTHALLPTSPAIDAGDDSVLGSPYFLTTDQRGEGFPRKACAHVDIGAYEFAGGVPPTVNCPGNIVVSNDPNQCSASVSFSVSATDPCGGAITPTCTVGGMPITSPHTFPVGVTTVTCSATGSSGLTGMCSFTVTVNDTQKPQFPNGCPNDVNTVAAASCPINTTGNVANFATPVATDNCPGVTVACVPPSGTVFPPGTTTVTCTATDTSGNTATCTFSIASFSFCLQDETNTGNFVLINANTGDYSFFCNNVQIASGRGTLNARGCQGSILHVKGDRRVNMEWDTAGAGGKGAGTAIVQLGVNNTKCQITDKNMSNNTCTAPPLGAAPVSRKPGKAHN